MLCWTQTKQQTINVSSPGYPGCILFDYIYYLGIVLGENIGMEINELCESKEYIWNKLNYYIKL